ncbi:MAG: type II toxin-antitoxin system Phd/YefM family antitoxin [Candidatus Methylacidiphilales bacterium]|nr:type II toxin-antitoxin system Phd/YefM family antitoxin [Candidatus Methylacidiphilales bacterium]
MTAHQLQEAKQRFSKVASQAARGKPQLVTKHGKPFVVIVSAEEWSQTRNTGTAVWDRLRACPEDLSLLVQPRSKDLPRNVGL